jgi:hypothetical protein
VLRRTRDVGALFWRAGAVMVMAAVEHLRGAGEGLFLRRWRGKISVLWFCSFFERGAGIMNGL